MNRYEQFRWCTDRLADFGIIVQEKHLHATYWILKKRYEGMEAATIAMIQALEQANVKVPKEVKERPYDTRPP